MCVCVGMVVVVVVECVCVVVGEGRSMINMQLGRQCVMAPHLGGWGSFISSVDAHRPCLTRRKGRAVLPRLGASLVARHLVLTLS